MKSYLFLFAILFVSKSFSQEKINLYFDFNIPEINVASTNELADWMRDNKAVEILKIHSYCDSIGSFDYNDGLALKRANSVLETIKNNGILLSDKLEIKSFGKRFKQSTVQADNRRVEIYFQTKGSSLTTQISHMKAGENLRLNNLNFYNASGILVPKSEPVLIELVQIMQQNPKLKIQIEGHICCEYIDHGGVSLLRSRTIYNYLIKNGIEKKRLSYKAYGSTRPIHPLPEQDEAQKDENRRVEIKILEM